MATVDWKDIVGNVLLFFLVFGMSATVDYKSLISQASNFKAILCGIFLQFVIMPLLGFIMVYTLKLNDVIGITLLVVTSSPGGSFSNWWCSLFNADLALSVTMTAISTLLSVVMLPANLILYARLSYDENIVEILNWWSLFIAIAIVIGAITLGLYTSVRFDSRKFHLNANRVGNLSGIALIVFSLVLSNSGTESPLWDRDWKFFFGVAGPCVFGLIIANIMTFLVKLKDAERVTVSIEICYQNIGIATSVALTMFEGEELSEALGVPIFYGMVEAILLAIYCLVVWKLGWTKAPQDASLWTALTTSYEVMALEGKDALISINEKQGVEMEQKETVVTDKAVEIDDDIEDDFQYVQHSDAEINADEV